MTTSDKIDKVVTNRWLGLPIFAVIMFLVYYISMVTVGSAATDWANDGLFGDGWHLLGIGSGSYNDAAEEYGDTNAIIDGYVAYLGDEGVDTEELEGLIDTESDDFDGEAAKNEILSYANTYNSDFSYDVEDEETLEVTTETATMDDLTGAADLFAEGEPDPADYGVWVPGIPVLIEKGLDSQRVLAECKSTSTEENFLFAKEILAQQGISAQEPVVYVTNAFHCYRGGVYAAMAGFTTAHALPAGIPLRSVLTCYLREAAAVIYYWLFKSSRTGFMQPLVGLLSLNKKFFYK